ncbi:DUF333 domain-containing protein [Aliivibrio sp. S4TY2]|uniref:DUF333 domain-containing protein n=1 Tax=unclassified Aliivibrio TaxID=2645654 RepID=UPI00237944F3|nr:MULTISPECIES: DUF333 domain-containing protein [unclassified Aliivibrio]MDD9157518.1 DUF333 domain-containing protein [Aliivibrio sp. S4TY2]MDD9161288.1 DUF333 domain-containing protein [Aliivibrio sp. S4TY1]MDD9165318.1 DUF333 domain-containing protein [Aliivibrio sp. S4MY2]MDD9169427.1 DUF333 domain-containing protein [Aliivibrio sp. S4MY4]MDD9186420.1 DUF333 domain-containing protein [Aliivibrio sp. S4MY3]
MLKKIAITLSLLLSLAACSSSEKEPSAKADMANPAAKFCAERGTYNLDSGNCTLGNGDVVNAWEYYRNHKQEMTKPVGKANPAAVYCIEQEGSYHLENSDCTLKTGEVVNAWDFYRSSL